MAVIFHRKKNLYQSEPTRARTEDPQIKSLLLYQLSYRLPLSNAETLLSSQGHFCDDDVNLEPAENPSVTLRISLSLP